MEAVVNREPKKIFNAHTSSSKMGYVVNASIAAMILLISSPLMLIIALLIKLQDGGSVFYRGERFGYKKKLFTMYKFRSLVPDAEQIIGAKLLKRGEGLETRVGKFLRDSRLDELPQLINVVNGTMVFLGPRPERPAVYEQLCKEIKDYDKRFEVKPGVFGYSQLFTPHGTSKRMRAYIDNYYVSGDDYLTEIGLVIYAFYMVGVSLIKRIFRIAAIKIKMLFHVNRIKSNRRFERRVHDEEKVNVALWYYQVATNINKVNDRLALMEPDNEIVLININEESLLIETEQKIDTTELNKAIVRFTVYIPYGIKGKKKIKTVYCQITDGVEIKENRYLLHYSNVSDLNHYKVDKYLLHKSVV